jgi:uncharacterized RDD family membrane protein YckC
LVPIPFALPGVAVVISAFFIPGTEICDDYGTTCFEMNVPALILGIAAFVLGQILGTIWMCRRLGRTGQTPGRKIMGYKIVNETSGLPIGSWKAFGRMIAGAADSALYIGYLWPLWDGKKQRWADKIMNTVAVKV